MYELWLEDKLVIKPDIKDKLHAIPNFIQFYWKTKELIKKTTKVIMQLKNEHDDTLIKNMFNKSTNIPSLSTAVNPSILRLIEEDDKADMNELGPVFQTSGPCVQSLFVKFTASIIVLKRIKKEKLKSFNY